MDPKLNQCVVGVFREVLEHLAFMFADPVQKVEVAGLSEGGMRVGMDFSGPISGSLSLAASRGVSAEIAANILGLDADDPKASLGAEDALKEMLNVICGRLLTSLAGEGPVFQLSVPQAAPLDAAEWARLLEAEDTQAFQADGSPLLLNVRMNPEG